LPYGMLHAHERTSVYRVRVHIPGGSSAHPYSNIVRSFPEIA
jgi:hypothetical protein